MRFSPQKIMLYCFGLCTKKPVLREVDLQPSPKSGSDKTNSIWNIQQKSRLKKSNKNKE